MSNSDRKPESGGGQNGSGQDATVFRVDMTVLRDESSLNTDHTTHSSWRSGAMLDGEPGEAEAPKVLKQRFVLEERIGSGGMGSVFRAKDLRKVEARGHQPFIAVKVLNNDFRHHPEAFIALEREASKSQGLRHTNIVSIFDFDKDGDVPFMTMELLEGDELADLLRAYPTGLPDELAWKTIQGMVAGLGCAHEEGVVHADFKPGNVYITQRKVAKILDFGIARAMRMNAGGEDTDFDPSRLAALTPAYASREMLNGDNPEPRDDLYSLGVVMYMVLTGHHPYGRLPADEAAREGLRPDRVRGLSRRRWRVLERCLAFNRQDRPADAAEVYEALFGKPAWHQWSMVGTAALVAVSLLMFTLQDTAEIREVKEEVRLETLMDAQIDRISDLLAAASFDSNWEHQLLSEVQTLHTVAPAHSANEMVRQRIEALYAEHIAAEENFDDAFALYASGAKFGELSQAADELHERLALRLEALSEATADGEWLQQAEQALSYAARYFGSSSRLSSARADLVGHVAEQIPAMVEAGNVAMAEQAWNTFGSEVFDEAQWVEVDRGLRSAVASVQQQRTAAQVQRTVASLKQDMDALLNVSCLRLDVKQVADRLHSLARRFPTHVQPLREQIGTRIEQCVERLTALDADRAWSLKDQAVRHLGSFSEIVSADVDPCALQYLVGNGRQSGRGGFCTDQIAGGKPGPRLVVVPAAENLPRFAISKYEISWAQFNAFCAASGQCEVSQADKLPVTGVSVRAVEAYAAWLSEITGYHYRLPTEEEWRLAARGEPDPNRNCRVDVGGVVRGDSLLAAAAGAANELGLVHVLGNAQELVKTGDASTDAAAEADVYVAVGGTYTDPIDRCLAETHRRIEPNGDAHTGFRLVREVS